MTELPSTSPALDDLDLAWDAGLVARAAGLVLSSYDGVQQAACLRHVIASARIAQQDGAGETLLAATFAHDLVEDTTVDMTGVADRLSPAVAAIVASLTEDDAISDYRERKAALREAILGAGPRAAYVFAAEKLARMRDLLRTGEPIDVTRLEHYRESLPIMSRLGAPAAWVGELQATLPRLATTRATCG